MLVNLCVRGNIPTVSFSVLLWLSLCSLLAMPICLGDVRDIRRSGMDM